MKKIGEGWQYSVYDLENGRVLKKFHSPYRAYLIILKDCFPFTKYPLWKISGFVMGMKIKARESFKTINVKNIPSNWMGNPRFLEGLNYEQDKV